jgi:hypothetical protein
MSNVRVEGVTVIPSTLPPMVANMTLHDWYAGMAMQGIIACPTTEGDHDALAKWSHEMADAMMEARKK